MFYINNLCSLCLAYNKKFTPRNSINSSAEDILQRIIPEFVQQTSEIQRKFCDYCLGSLTAVIEFRRKCLKNIIIFDEYIRKLQSGYGSYKYLRVTLADIKLDIKKEIKKEIITDENTCYFENDFHTNYLEVNENIKQQNCYNRHSNEEQEEYYQKSDVVLDIKKEISEEVIPDEDTCFLEADLTSNFLKLCANIKQEHSYNRECNEEQHENDAKSNVTPIIYHKSDTEKSNEPPIQEVDCDDRIECTDCCEEIRNHMRNTDPLKCQKCQTISARNKTQKVHFANKLHSCNYNTCNKSFSSISRLKVHERLHTDKNPNPYGLYRKKFTQFGSGKSRQQRYRTNKRPFLCNICRQGFAQACSLRKHNLTHIDKGPFKCDVCEKSFKKASNLEKHKIIHTSDKQFECGICNNRFIQKSGLILHNRIHSEKRPFQCNLCEEKFAGSYLLRLHLETHVNDKPNECIICKLRFKNAHYLRLHKLLHAKEMPLKSCKREESLDSSFSGDRNNLTELYLSISN